MGPHARARRLVGRLGGGAGRRAHRPRGGQRHRLVDPQPRALLRRLRPQADLGHRAARRPRAARPARAGRHRRRRSAGAQRRRSRRVALGVHRRARRDRRRGLAAHAAAAAEEAAARFQGRRSCSTRPVTAVDREVQDRLQKLGDFLAKKKVKVDDRARPGDRHRRGVSASIAAAARGDVGAPEPTPSSSETEAARALAPDDEQLLRARAARGRAAPSRLARRQRGAPPDAARLGRFLQAITTCCSVRWPARRVPARPAGRALRAHAARSTASACR